MLIAFDKDIPYAREFFTPIGEVLELDGRAVVSRDIAEADILVVRSVTRVDRSLLDNSRVGFVGTVTSGSDHIDRGYLAANGIGFADARGSNARAVAEYVLSSLLVVLDQRGETIENKVAGIIGKGHVGSVVGNFLEALGIQCRYYDPPLQEQAGGHFSDIGEILAADIISLHVPLESDGAHPTSGMISKSLLEKLRQDVILINTSRGEVIVEDDLQEFLANNRQSNCILDVWCREPDINTTLLSGVTLGTAHIAGYTLDAKLRATQMIYGEVCRYAGISPGAVPEPPVMEMTALSLELADHGDELDLIRMAVLRSYDVRTDSGALHDMLDQERPMRGKYFDELRNNYRIRREFTAVNVSIPAASGAHFEKLGKLGFNLQPCSSQD